MKNVGKQFFHVLYSLTCPFVVQETADASLGLEMLFHYVLGFLPFFEHLVFKV